MKKIIPPTIALIPWFASAAGDIAGTLDLIKRNVLEPVLIFLPGVAIVVFIWGVVKYMQSAGEEDVSEAKRFIAYGLIGLFIMTSVWALVKVIESTLGTSGGDIPGKVGELK